MFTFSTELFSDLHKDVYGFRPRDHWFYNTNTTDAERQQEWDYLCDRLDQQIKQDRIEKEAAFAHLQANIARNIALGAKDRDTAIRWIVQSLNPTGNDLWYGGEWVCYELGLDYSYKSMFDKACKDLQAQFEEELV